MNIMKTGLKSILKYCMMSAAMLFFSVTLFAQEQYLKYTFSRKNVYYGKTYVREADFDTFRDLGYGYAKDRNHVYRYGKILEFVVPSSFKVDAKYAAYDDVHRHPNPPHTPKHPAAPAHPVRPEHPGHPEWSDCPEYGKPGTGSGYHITTFDVFFNGKKIPDATASSFRILKDGYAKDAFNVYCMGKKIHDATGSSFECLGCGYAKDAFNVYWMGHKIKDAFASSFKVLKDGYAEDPFNTYYRGKKVD